MLDVSAKVERIEYDPNRTAFIALVKYDNNNFSYIICPQNLKKGIHISSDKADIKVGNCLQLRNMPTDTIIHNIELKPGKVASFLDLPVHMDNLLEKMQITLR